MIQCEAMTKANGKVAPYRCRRPATHENNGKQLCQAHWVSSQKPQKQSTTATWKNGPGPASNRPTTNIPALDRILEWPRPTLDVIAQQRRIHEQMMADEISAANAIVLMDQVKSEKEILLSALKECLENTGGGWISARVIENARAVVEMFEPSPPALGSLTPEQEKAADANVKQEKK